MTSLYMTWAQSLVRRRRARIFGTVAGIAVAVAMLATLAGFFAATESSMTKEAISSVAVDWQIQLAPGTNPQTAIDELQRAPGANAAIQVGFFDTPGFEATTGNTTQTTGPGKVLGLGDGYRVAFPAEVRDLVGSGKVLLAQQTAANLHAAVGTKILIKRPGLESVQVTVDGVIDLPLADSLFQVVGAPSGAAPQAPPDNVVLLPLDQWHALFDPVAPLAPTAVTMQIHASIPHTLPSSPTSAFTKVSGLARNYETRMAGAGVVGDNLAARLDAARSDSLYARVLFLFLGLPGAILAAILTIVLIASSAVQRRREQALIRLRGATTSEVLKVASVEGLVIGVCGGVLGLAIGTLGVILTFHRWLLGNSNASSLLWAAIAAFTGILLALMMLVLPAWTNVRETAIASSRMAVRRQTSSWWERIGLDVTLLAISGLIYWRAARGGYQLVLAPEGVPKVAVSYTSFIAPLFLWAGVALFVVRLSHMLLARNGRPVKPLISPFSGKLTPLVAASMSRQRSRLAIGITLVMLAVAFAASTAIFNSTYQAQALVDAELSNGADVTVTGGAASDLAGNLPRVSQLSGVNAVQPMQHRFAYVGTDLQDLYGVNPTALTDAARLSDAYFVGASAKEVMTLLAENPDGVLVSPETVLDFQLQPGDMIKLRLQSAADQQYHVVQFHYVGIAREFPTAPSDSFLVANADYVAQQTGSATVETLLIKTNSDPSKIAGTIRQLIGPTSGTTVQDIKAERRIINSSLTAVSLRGLTRVELTFAVLLAAAGAGLVLALGLEERRRMLAIATALGAKPRQIGAFVWSEAGLILVGGITSGAALGWGVSHMLIKLLTQVFDPPPQQATIPWGYLLLVGTAVVIAIGMAAQSTIRRARQDIIPTIRRL